MRSIPIVRAEPGMVLAHHIYNSRGHLLLKAGTSLNSSYIEKLQRYGVMRIQIEDDRTDGIEVPLALSFEVQLQALEAARDLLESGKVPNKHVVKRVEEAIEGIVADLTDSPKVLVHLTDWYTAEDALFFHAVHTSVLSLTLGLAMRSNEQRMKNIGTAAFLHDVGLSRVPDEVLSRGVNMSEEERMEFNRHPIYGYALMQNIPDVTSVSARAILQHHEWINGEGYPSGLDGPQISDIAKIISVADYYDSHVSPQWYRESMLPHEGMEALLAQSEKRFDKHIVEIFLRRVAVYPIGSAVKLNSGHTGFVSRLHHELPLRPVVRVVVDPDGEQLREPYELDLLANPTVQVTAIVQNL